MPAVRNRQGITLIELLVALSLLGIVVGVASQVLVSSNHQAVLRLREGSTFDSTWLARSALRVHCRDSLVGLRIAQWPSRMDACLHPWKQRKDSAFHGW